jgi:hypothetical protein
MPVYAAEHLDRVTEELIEFGLFRKPSIICHFFPLTATATLATLNGVFEVLWEKYFFILFIFPKKLKNGKKGRKGRNTIFEHEFDHILAQFDA